MWESRVLRRAFERLELHEGKLSRAVLRGGGGGDVTSLPDTWVGNHPGLPGPEFPRMPERARTDPWEPHGSNPLGPPGPNLAGYAALGRMKSGWPLLPSPLEAEVGIFFQCREGPVVSTSLRDRSDCTAIAREQYIPIDPSLLEPTEKFPAMSCVEAELIHNWFLNLPFESANALIQR